MDELDKEQLEVFKELFDITEEYDIELIRAFYLDDKNEVTCKRECITQFVFRVCAEEYDNEEMREEVRKKIYALSDLEFALFDIVFFEDVLVVFAYI